MSESIAPKPLCLLLGVGLCLLPATAAAAIYGYMDDKGVMHFTNAPIDGRYQLISPAPAKKTRRIKLIAGDFERHIQEAAQRFQIDPLLIKAVIWTESCFDCRAVSKRGAQGLMQLMPETAHDMGVFNPFDPKENIQGGTRYLRKMLDLFKGNLRLALAAYNAGPDRVQLLGQVPRFRETIKYVEQVLRLYRQYQAAAAAGKTWVTIAYD
ncbi:MAG: transglycosylase SLT domain-containing protein [Deltaproteobacteria bacterium]|jgi:soluble lytic murein transglycosylase-like protein